MATANTNLSVYDADEVPSGKNFAVALVVSEWNAQITGPLFQGAYDTLIQHEVSASKIVRINVPGSFELIYGAKHAQSKGFDAVIVIGSVIQGETKHFDFVCEGVAQGIKDLNIQSTIPIIFCVLTDNNLQQAIDRSGGKHGNKGIEAAVAALKMAQLSKQ
ncbi:6,7-dimethyl-8-ribityllumazine synthase [Flavobacteriaceae bacterium]|nr:6,7-dimethyl-8-ribityllumazine synthase [Flavobacteriaceae bacterium]